MLGGQLAFSFPVDSRDGSVRTLVLAGLVQSVCSSRTFGTPLPLKSVILSPPINTTAQIEFSGKTTIFDVHKSCVFSMFISVMLENWFCFHRG